jgi:hypothetical protein
MRIPELTCQYIVTINPLFRESNAFLKFAPGRKQEHQYNSNNSQKRVFILERGEAMYTSTLLRCAQFQLKSLQDHGTHEMTMQPDKPRFLFFFVCKGLMERAMG